MTHHLHASLTGPAPLTVGALLPKTDSSLPGTKSSTGRPSKRDTSGGRRKSSDRMRVRYGRTHAAGWDTDLLAHLLTSGAMPRPSHRRAKARLDECATTMGAAKVPKRRRSRKKLFKRMRLW